MAGISQFLLFKVHMARSGVFIRIPIVHQVQPSAISAGSWRRGEVGGGGACEDRRVAYGVKLCIAMGSRPNENHDQLVVGGYRSIWKCES